MFLIRRPHVAQAAVAFRIHDLAAAAPGRTKALIVSAPTGFPFSPQVGQESDPLVFVSGIAQQESDIISTFIEMAKRLSGSLALYEL